MKLAGSLVETGKIHISLKLASVIAVLLLRCDGIGMVGSDHFYSSAQKQIISFGFWHWVIFFTSVSKCWELTSWGNFQSSKMGKVEQQGCIFEYYSLFVTAPRADSKFLQVIIIRLIKSPEGNRLGSTCIFFYPSVLWYYLKGILK